MIFSNFTEETKSYLKSVRQLKDFVSFDVYIKESWSIPKKYTEGIEVIASESPKDGLKLFSFVVKNEKELVDQLEKGLSNIFNYNKEKEEKEKLFREKVQELKGMFETKDVSDLKSLQFEIKDGILQLDTIEDEEREGNTEDGDMVQEREVEGQSRGEEV